MTQETQIEQETRLSVVIPPDLKAGLENLARQRERSLSAEIRLALRRHLLASTLIASGDNTTTDGGGRP